MYNIRPDVCSMARAQVNQIAAGPVSLKTSHVVWLLNVDGHIVD
jgi:hypothetical protein